MYPKRELKRLELHKTALRREMARGRMRCVLAATRVTRPIQWFDRAVALRRRLSPYAVALLGLLACRAVTPRRRFLRTLVRWGPFLAGAVRFTTAAAHARAGPVEASNGRG